MLSVTVSINLYFPEVRLDTMIWSGKDVLYKKREDNVERLYIDLRNFSQVRFILHFVKMQLKYGQNWLALMLLFSPQ